MTPSAIRHPPSAIFLVDTHAHFDAWPSAAEQDEALARAAKHGVRRVVAIGGRDEANALAADLARRRPDAVCAAAGWDRDRAGQPNDESALRALLSRPEVVAVGETGLDYRYSADTAAAQRDLFARMLSLSREFRKPVVVHTREADADTLDLLREHARLWPDGGRPPGVIHCFTGTPDFATALLDLGFYMSFSGIATFPKADNVRASVRVVPPERMVVETDTPYLAPVPHRGRTNEPAYLSDTAKFLAAFAGLPYDAFSRLTAENAGRLFGCQVATGLGD
jgi:TatD DNase family protein